MNYYRRFPGDYLGDTQTLTLRQHGAYALLLDYQYSTEKPITGIRQANLICRSADRSDQRAVRFVLFKYFPLSADGHWNNRVKEEIAYASNKSKQASHAATSRHERDKIATPTRHERDTDATEPRHVDTSNSFGNNETTMRTHSGRTAILDSRLQTPDLTSKTKDIERVNHWPSDLVLLPAMAEYAVARGIPDPQKEFDSWRDDCLAHGRKYSNWMAAWRTRVNRYQEFNGRGKRNAEKESATSLAIRNAKAIWPDGKPN